MRSLPDIDYDSDDDGLIEVATEAQLNAIRWDLGGDGAVDDSASDASYAAAFADAMHGMGCPGTCTGYELAADITLTSDTGMGWEPIGDTTDPFTANFDGNAPDYRVDRLFINRTTDNIGLFGVTGNQSSIRNVKLTRVNVTGNDVVGALVGRNAGAIDNCEVTGTVTGNSLLGGLVGRNYGPISGSSASVAVTATRTDGSALAGGLVGQNLDAAVIRNSHASGNVTASQNTVGGLVGSNYDAMAWTTAAPPRNAISGSTASGTVTTTGSNVGGLVGWNNGTISDSAALNPSVSGAAYVGGLVGSNHDVQADGSNTISGSTARGTVTITVNNAGGLVGWSNGPISDSYASGAVRGGVQMGGLVGLNAAAGQVIDSRADGAVGNSTVAGRVIGGLVGLNQGSVAGSVATGDRERLRRQFYPWWPGWRKPWTDQRQCGHRRGQWRPAGRRVGRVRRRHWKRHRELGPRRRESHRARGRNRGRHQRGGAGRVEQRPGRRQLRHRERDRGG